ncbi:hypothetical protein HDU92_004412 [Lobulomyces angularis]|nr:hypothetical protein HDU92_004412 [Lobulomyces angularis]
MEVKTQLQPTTIEEPSVNTLQKEEENYKNYKPGPAIIDTNDKKSNLSFCLQCCFANSGNSTS